MKKLFILFLFSLLLGAKGSKAQIFWTEKFESGSSSSFPVASYVGPNGAWTETTSLSGPDGSSANAWYVTCAESGHIAGACGSGCGSPANATLHIGSTTLGDLGASYDAGGSCGPLPYPYSSIYGACINTDKRAESPTINCTGKTNILLKFYYIENGDGVNDNATVWYSANNGVTWGATPLLDPPKTPLGCAPQGQWAMDTVRLPASANNNPNVKIAFRWVNNDDGIGTDPSFAVDSVSLSTTVVVVPPVATFSVTSTTTCQDSCITATSTTTGTVDSVRWTTTPTTSVTIASPTANTTGICFGAAGTYTVTLKAYNSGGSNTVTHVITVKQAPHPVITFVSGSTIKVPTVYASYQWYNGTSPIVGATNNTYTYTVPPGGHFSVVVDSGGCKHASSNIYSVGIGNVGNPNSSFWLSQQDNNSIILHSNRALDDQMLVSIFDATGRKILDEVWPRGSEMKQIDVVSLPKGLYILKLNNESTSAVFKWTKQ